MRTQMLSHHHLGRFELQRRLASGGMADIYLARSLGMGGFERQLAIKVLRRTDDPYVAMFLDEARQLASLHHRHIVQAYELGCTVDGVHYLVMEYVRGHTLRTVLQAAVDRDVLVPLDFALTVISNVASALHHAHRHGIIHRDVSPSNVLIGHDGGVKLIDFGIAKSEDRLSNTQAGFLKGKSGYMAPEQARGYAVDLRADLYSLGVLAYELTTRRRAFPATSHEEHLRQLTHRALVSPSIAIPGYPEVLEHVVMTLLEEDPDDRFHDAQTLQLAIDAIGRDLELVLGASCIERVLGDLFDHDRDTARYTVDLPVDLFGAATPTPVYTPPAS